MTIVKEGDPVIAPDQEAPLMRALDEGLANSEGEAKLVAPSGQEYKLPHSVFDVLEQVVAEMAKGNAVKVLPVHAELTTQQAADLLNVSRPYLIQLLEEGEIEYRMVGSHRRVRLDELLVYKEKRDRNRMATLDDMAREAQEEGFYDE